MTNDVIHLILLSLSLFIFRAHQNQKQKHTHVILSAAKPIMLSGTETGVLAGFKCYLSLFFLPSCVDKGRMLVEQELY